MNPLLKAQNISKAFTQTSGQIYPVISEINLDLTAGEIVCLLGASGSGKTTLLRILAGIDNDYQGQIQSEIKRPGPEIGYLSQNAPLLPWRSVIANIALGPELLGMPKQRSDETALAVLEQVGLSGYADHRPSELSGGMQQRVLLARTLALKPSLLLLDEPMSNLDVLARRELSKLIKNYIRDHQAAALVVTHSVEEACFLADRIYLVTRSPARLFKEIRLSDNQQANDHTQGYSKDMDMIMRDLWQALEPGT